MLNINQLVNTLLGHFQDAPQGLHEGWILLTDVWCISTHDMS